MTDTESLTSVNSINKCLSAQFVHLSSRKVMLMIHRLDAIFRSIDDNIQFTRERKKKKEFFYVAPIPNWNH